MTCSQFFKHFDLLADQPDAVAKMRELVLQLAIRGKIVEQIASEQKDDAWQKFLKSGSGDSSADDLPPFDIPKDWRWAPLDAVADYSAARKVEPAEISEKDWVLDLEEIEKDTGRLLRFTTFKEKQSSSNKAKFVPGDVLYGKLRPYLNKVLVAPKAGFCTTEIVPIRSRGMIVPTYLCLFLRSPHFVAYTNDKSYGMKMPRLGTEDAIRAWIAVPPPAEQRRIVAKVDELMALCDELAARQQARHAARAQLQQSALHHLLAARDPHTFTPAWQRVRDQFHLLHDTPDAIPQLRQAILQLAVQGRLVPQNPKDEPATVFLDKVRQARERETTRARNNSEDDTNPKFVAHLPDRLPANWSVCPLEELFRFIDYRGRTPHRTSSGVRLITAKNVRQGYVSDEPVEYIDRAVYPKWMTRGFPNRGDILFVTEGHTMGFAGMPNFDFQFALAQRTINLQPFFDGYSQFFLLVLLSEVFQSAVRSNATGSAAKGIKAAKLKRIRIVVPPLAEQKRIVARVEALLRQCDALAAQLRQTRTLGAHLLDSTIHHLAA